MRRALLLALAALLACSEGRTPGPATPDRDAAAATADTGSVPADDAGPTTPDDAAATGLDATTPGGACSFNDDCPADQRCACSNGDCACEVGPRGTGVSGVTACTDGNDCASALCIEGPGNDLVCSSACENSTDCPPTLPRCLSVPFVGSFCARDPATAGDAGVSSDAGVAGCTGDCATTELQAVFRDGSGDFTRAQHGVVAATGNIRVEAHFGGDPACPEEQSPSPDRTMIVTGITTAMRTQTDADGVRATLLDFRGDLTSTPVLRAIAVSVTPRFVQPGTAVSYEIEANFPQGTISGGLYAEHCTSLDE